VLHHQYNAARLLFMCRQKKMSTMLREYCACA
jgi:hypothetical protein